MMKRLHRITKPAIAAILLTLVTAGNAHAYLDPGTGSYLLQIIMAGALGAAFTVKVFWRNVKKFFSDIFSKKDKT